MLFKIVSGVACASSGLVSDMRATKYDHPFPWNSGVPTLQTSSEMRLEAVSYIEDSYQYVLEIMAKCVEKILGKITSISPREQPRVCSHLYRMGVSRSPEWYIRIHFPYRITQLGAPLLILSVLYKRMAESLILQGKLEKSRADEDLLRIWESTRRKINSMIDVVNSHSRRCSGTPPPSSIFYLKKSGPE
jgi:hypothetical protein